MNKLLIRLIAFEKKHITACLSAVLMLFLLSLFVVISPNYSTDMLEMFREDSGTRQILSESVNSGLLNNISIYFSKGDGSAFGNSDDLSFIEETVKRLRTSDPGIIDIFWSSSQISVHDGICNFMEYVPQLYPPDILPKNDDELKAALQKCYRQLAVNPFAGRRIMGADPFLFSSKVWKNLEKMLLVSGLKIAPGSNLLLSEDRKFCLVMLRTNVSAAEVFRCKSLLAHLNGALDAVPEGIQAEIFSAHTHTMDNQTGMLRDLWIFSCSSAILFTILFFFVYKNDLYGLLIPLLGFAACVIAAAIMMVIYRRILIFAIGIGGVLIGLGVDYGIHLYAVSRSKKSFRKTVHIIPPLFFAFLTTACSFCGFIFTQIPVFIQFGLFAILMLSITFLLMLFIMPGVSGRTKDQNIFAFLESIFNHPGKVLTISAVILMILIYGCFHFNYRADILDFDFSRVLHGNREQICRDAFASRKRPEVMLCTQPDETTLFSVMRENLRLIREADPQAEIFSPLDFTQPAEKRKLHLQQWQTFLMNGQWQEFRNRFDVIASQHDFSSAFFKDFFVHLEKGIRNPPSGEPLLFSHPVNSMIGKGKSGRVSGICLLRPTKDLSNLKIRGHIISEQTVTSQIYNDLLGKLPAVAWCTLGIITVFIFLYLRSVKKTFYAFLPIVCSITAIIGIHGLCGKEITPAVLVSCIITIGISVDYGIIAASYPARRIQELVTPISLSAVTTVIGGLTVAFTRHPMLHSAGITIIAGIISAWFCTLFFVPCLEYVLNKVRIKPLHLVPVAALVPACLLTACAGQGQPFGSWEIKPVGSVQDCRPPELPPGEFEASCVFDSLFAKASFLIAGKTDGEKCTMAVLSLAGAKIMDISGTMGSDAEIGRNVRFITPKQARYLGEKLYRAFTCYLAPIPADGTGKRGNHGEYIWTGGDCKIIYSGTPPEMIFKSGSSGEVRIYPKDNGRIRFIYSEPWSFFSISVKMKFYTMPKGDGKNA